MGLQPIPFIFGMQIEPWGSGDLAQDRWTWLLTTVRFLMRMLITNGGSYLEKSFTPGGVDMNLRVEKDINANSLFVRM